MLRTGEIPKEEKTLIRTIAGAARPLDEDLNLSPLQAIDRLQKFSEKFRELWLYYSPWLVLKDGWTLAAQMPVQDMLADIKTHGEPVGIVGIAELTFSKRDAVLRLYFRKDKKSRETVDASAGQAVSQRDALQQGVFWAEVFLDETTNEIAMQYSFMPKQPPKPGVKRVGGLAYKQDGKMVSYFHSKHYAEQYADVMEQGKEHFREVIKRLYEIQRSEVGNPKGRK